VTSTSWVLSDKRSTLQEVSLVLHVDPVVGIGRVRFEPSNAGPVLGQVGIDGNEVALIVGHVFLGEDRIHRALGDADGAVDALVWVDDQKVWPFAKAVDGADVHAIGEATFDAGFCDDVCHGDVACAKSIILDRIVVSIALE
jgi:hypothetical protein